MLPSSPYVRYAAERAAEHNLTEAERDAFARHVTGRAFDTALEQTPSLLLSAMVAKGDELKWFAARLTGQMTLGV
jgi:hypothetical protein